MNKITLEYASDSKWMAPIKFTGDCLKRLRSGSIETDPGSGNSSDRFAFERHGTTLRWIAAIAKGARSDGAGC